MSLPRLENERLPRRRPRRAERGFNLLEMMLAISILSVSLMGVGQLLLVAIQQNDFARYNTAATQLARGKFEALKAAYDAEIAGRERLAVTASGSHGPEVLTPAGAGDETPKSYSVSWQITDLGDGVRQVTVLVRPQGMDSPETQAPMRAKSVAITGLLTP